MSEVERGPVPPVYFLGGLLLQWGLHALLPMTRIVPEAWAILGAESNGLVLVAVAMASGEQHTTDHLQTWPGSIVDWRLGPTAGLSYASVF